jgi:hypothetical protein
MIEKGIQGDILLAAQVNFIILSTHVTQLCFFFPY